MEQYQFSDLEWKFCPGGDGKAAYEEASLAEYFGDLYEDLISVTIRRYPKRYVIALQYEDWDDFDARDFDPYEDCITVHFRVWDKLMHSVLETHFDHIMKQLRHDLEYHYASGLS